MDDTSPSRNVAEPRPPTAYLHLMDGGHLLRDQDGHPLVGQLGGEQGPRVYVLLDAAAGEEAEQLGAEAPLGEQREDDAVGD